MVVVADAGMLSAKNLRELDEAGLRFIVGSQVTKAPKDLASHFRWHGDAFTDGQVIDTLTPRTAPRAGTDGENDPALRAEPVWDPARHPGSWRAVWAYSTKRAARDGRTLTAQENRARAVVAGEKTARTPGSSRPATGPPASTRPPWRAPGPGRLKGYVTNIPATLMPAGEVIGSYHDLWHVEQSFRMSKTDLRARPMFHHTRDAIEAHLTIVFTALAVWPARPRTAPAWPSATSCASSARCAQRRSRSTAQSRPSTPDHRPTAGTARRPPEPRTHALTD